MGLYYLYNVNTNKRFIVPEDYNISEYIRDNSQLPVGYEFGHREPFSIVGEGKVYPQLKIENCSYGARNFLQKKCYNYENN